MSSLVCIRESWSHMGRRSGFDKLFKEIKTLQPRSTSQLLVPSHHYEPTILNSILGRARHLKPQKPPRRPTSPFTESRHELVAAQAYSYALRKPEAIILLSVGESQYCGALAHADKKIRQRIALFLHQPPSWLEQNWGDWRLMDDLKAVFCLGPQQQKYVESKVRCPVYCIRHGVDLDYFSPPRDGRRYAGDPKLLFVGQWLRDFKTLWRAYQILKTTVPGISMDCVIPHDHSSDPSLRSLAGDRSVRWHCRLSDRKLRSLYRDATGLFLPLLDAVANNALLEALATTLPIVASNVGDVSFYLQGSSANLCRPGCAESHASMLSNLCQDRVDYSKATDQDRAYALQCLGWNRIATETLEILKVV
jgi:glycosyltransferase involved in cell wall biosynthesis